MKGVYQSSWMTPHLHRHGEVEVNILESGSLHYIFGNRRTVLQKGEIGLFWATIPHQIIQTEESTILHWLNIPLNIFLQMKLFRQYFGISIVDYITKYRLSHAQHLLITTNDNILEIAIASGFGSISSFYTIFKSVCGISPRAYRNAYSLMK